MQRLGVKAGIERRCHPHILRHSRATHLVDEGTNPLVIQDLLGHADISTTTIYAKVSTERMWESLKSAERNRLAKERKDDQEDLSLAEQLKQLQDQVKTLQNTLDGHGDPEG